MTKDVSVTLRMSEELKGALQKLALEDRRTLSAYIEMILEKHVDAAFRPDGYSTILKVYEGQNQRHAKKSRLRSKT